MAIVLWHRDKSDSELRETVLPTGNNLVKVTSHYSYISQGTERTVALGMVPGSSMEQMKVPFMQGELSLPCTYGYSLSGIVTQPGHPLENKPVQLMHPHQDQLVVPENSLRLVPETLTIKRSLLAANMETAVNAVWNSRLQPGDEVLVMGFGSVGALTSMAVQNMTGASVTVCETNEYRKDIARKMGFPLWERTGSFPVVFHSTATSKGLQHSIDILEDYGKVIELSWYGAKKVEVNLGGSFHFGNKQIISSQVSTIPPHMTGWDFQKRLELVWHLLGDERCDLLLDLEIPFNTSPGFFDRLRKGTIDEIGAYIKY